MMETLAKVVDRSEPHAQPCGHFVLAEHPEELTRLITGFVNARKRTGISIANERRARCLLIQCFS
jgi:hypothetical protein